MSRFAGSYSSYIRGGLAVICAVAALPQVAAPARAADFTVGTMHIVQPWARATPKGASAAAGYMTVTNSGDVPDRLSCVSSEAAARCEIHTMTLDGGVMKMRPVDGGLEIAPGATLTLKPSSLHVMLIDLKHPLEKDKTVGMTLRFEKAGTVEIALPVVAIGAPAPGIVSGGGSMMEGGSMMKQEGGSMMKQEGGSMMKQEGGSMMKQDKP